MPPFSQWPHPPLGPFMSLCDDMQVQMYVFFISLAMISDIFLHMLPDSDIGMPEQLRRIFACPRRHSCSYAAPCSIATVRLRIHIRKAIFVTSRLRPLYCRHLDYTINTNRTILLSRMRQYYSRSGGAARAPHM